MKSPSEKTKADDLIAAVCNVPGDDPIAFLCEAIEYAQASHENVMAAWLFGIVTALRNLERPLS